MLMFLVAAVKDLARGHVTEKVAIHPRDLTITDVRLPSPTGLDDHPRPMHPREVRIASMNEGVAYLQAGAGKTVTAPALLETKGGMAWDESQCVGGVGTPHLLITVVDLWRVDEETRPLLDSTWNVAEVHLEVEVGLISFNKQNSLSAR